MATFHRVKDESGREVIRAFVKGAWTSLPSRAENALTPDGQVVAASDMVDRFNAENERLAKNGLRVMAAARRDYDAATFNPNADLLPLVSNLTLLALAGIVDPPRPEAGDAIAEAHAAGIQVRMITGDHAVTAAAIAKDLVSAVKPSPAPSGATTATTRPCHASTISASSPASPRSTRCAWSTS